jgi:hypothetical protein
MADLDRLPSRVQMMLSTRRTKRAEKQQEVEDSMQALGRRQDHFVEMAAKIFETVVEPRLKLMRAPEILRSEGTPQRRRMRGTPQMGVFQHPASGCSASIPHSAREKPR